MLSKSNNQKKFLQIENRKKELSWVNGDYDYSDYYNLYNIYIPSCDYDFEIDLGYLEDDITEFRDNNNSTLDYPEDLYFY